MTAKELTRRGNPGVLMDRPQRWGILPTWWFWRDRQVARIPIVSQLLLPAQFVILAAGGTCLGLFLQPLLSGTTDGLATLAGVCGGDILGAGGNALTFGIAERYLRRKIIERRQQVLATPAIVAGDGQGQRVLFD